MSDQQFKIDVDTPWGYLEGLPAVFDVETEEFEAEPYSWGGSRGKEKTATARFVELRLGDLTLRENEAIAAFGRETVAHWEGWVETKILEEMH